MNPNTPAGVSANLQGALWMILAGGAYALTIALAATALPSLHEVPNEFPADVLWGFRAASFSGHILFWVLLAAAFAAFQTATRSRSPRRYFAA